MYEPDFMRRYAIILNQFALDFGIDVPFSGLICPQVAENKLRAFLSIVFPVIFGNHLGAMASLVIRIIAV